MKRLFTRPFVPKPAAANSAPDASPAPANPAAHHVGLQPKDILPPVPHPCPYEHISLLATPEGLLMRPRHPGRPQSEEEETEVKIDWGKGGKVQTLASKVPGAQWDESAVVYGIVGFLELYSASYLLVVSSRTPIGDFFDPRHTVYGVKGVTAIPLEEERAQAVLAALVARNKVDRRTSLLPPEVPQEEDLDGEATGVTASDGRASPRVKFAEELDIKMVSPRPEQTFDLADGDRPPSPSSSTASTPSSIVSTNSETVVKTLANRLSFWSLASRRNSKHNSIDHVLMEQPGTEEVDPVNAPSIIKDPSKEPEEVIESIIAASAPAPDTAEQRHSELEEKIVRECVREFSRGGMYFTYTFDMTRSLQHKHELVSAAKSKTVLLDKLDALDESQRLGPATEKVDVLVEPSAALPLWRRVDRRFWWNEWLSKPLIDAGLHSYVMPIMQGFFQVSSFQIEREPVADEEGDSVAVEYVVISRRSRDRAGLRYQRRGIDDDSNVANFVETETIMRVEREGFANVFAHVQVRGSIPLYWNQQGAGLKPAPQLDPDRTHDQNSRAISRHLSRVTAAYGPLTIVNLAELHGKEGQVTNAFGDYVSELASEDVRYHAYDFHAETRGMKYENISNLIDKLERTFESQGYFWISSDRIMSQQKGVFRVNCIDCLDRTNVVESAFARHVLNRQLGAVALLNQEDGRRTEMDVVFNDVWANNGDAISRFIALLRAAADVSPLCRTGKRDLAGMLNDGVNSLARMYTSTFADWFSQAVIDFMLGTRTTSVFSEFLNKLQSTDPRDLIRISKIRADAIATCVSRVLSEGERLLSGWTLFAPEQLNAKVGDKFEEKVLLLSVKALYIISYDYTLEKVKIYTRVPLGEIVGITKGVYILSPLEEASRDPLQNAGFVVTWNNSDRQDTRVASYSIRNSLDFANTPPSPPPRKTGSRFSIALPRRPTLPMALSRVLAETAGPTAGQETIFAAFKALPVDPARARRETGSFIQSQDDYTTAQNCKEAVDLIVNAIQQACKDLGNEHQGLLEEADVVSLADAQRMTSVYAKMEYGVKRLLWLGS
ncbi:SacI homology domain-containing protein [Epithele typhae]|uniref:SacI homology domain-containing protein n=1 Tax=Epithele typhae TaxID=378194 RepID=UPI00200806ED|nr:SacI homology domain-containing protein [Epithele typhae]KAH9945870.1 SacI homology domain-containing protein [Epithele typhae]